MASESRVRSEYDSSVSSIGDAAASAIKSEFYNSLQKFQSILQNENLNLEGTCKESPFTKLDASKQAIVNNGLGISVAALEGALRDGVPLMDENHSLVWWSLRKMGMRPLSDVFGLLEKDDVIEVYNSDFIQVFRSLNMFKYLSYSLEEILCYEWFQLFRRDQSITDSLLNIARDMGAGKIHSTVNPNLPVHSVEEVFSQRQNWARMKFRFITPLFERSQPVGLLTVSKVVSFGSVGELDN